jgi:hypothetical protein
VEIFSSAPCSQTPPVRVPPQILRESPNRTNGSKTAVMKIISFLCVSLGMNECLRGWPSRPLHRDLVVYCASPFSVIHSATPRFEWSEGFWKWGRQSGHLVPKSSDPSDVILDKLKPHPSDVILDKLKPHTRTGYVWLFRFLFYTSHKWYYYLVPVWTGVLSVDSVL